MPETCKSEVLVILASDVNGGFAAKHLSIYIATFLVGELLENPGSTNICYIYFYIRFKFSSAALFLQKLAG